MENEDKVDEIVCVRKIDAQKENTAEKRKGSFDGDGYCVCMCVRGREGGRAHAHSVDRKVKLELPEEQCVFVYLL